jgi:hypothetical protein
MLSLSHHAWGGRETFCVSEGEPAVLALPIDICIFMELNEKHEGHVPVWVDLSKFYPFPVQN